MSMMHSRSDTKANLIMNGILDERRAAARAGDAPKTFDFLVHQAWVVGGRLAGLLPAPRELARWCRALGGWQRCDSRCECGAVCPRAVPCALGHVSVPRRWLEPSVSLGVALVALGWSC